MAARDIEFLTRLKATFRIEAEEHVRAISAGLIELEAEPPSERVAEIIETVFREAHSLKGAARSVGLTDIESICQPLEGAFSALKRQEIAVSRALSDLLHQSVAVIAQLVSSADAESTPADSARAARLIRQLEEASAAPVQLERPEEPGQTAEAPPTEIVPVPTQPTEEAVLPGPLTEVKPVLAVAVRIPTARLDPLLMQAEEMVSMKTAARQRANEAEEISFALASWRTESAKWKTRVSTADVSLWNDWQGWNETQLSALDTRMAAMSLALEQDQRTVKRMVDEHLEATKRLLMLPVASLVEAFPMVVRDLAHDQGKEAELVIHGAEIGIDKRILEELKDPFLHLIRNCIDHGIGKPEERASRNKSPRGTIAMDFTTKDSRHVEILVSDDGEGIDVAQVLTSAVEKGIVSQEAADRLDEQEALSLIFRSGISTSPMITDISGRGLGLAIVREKVEKLGGVVSVENRAHVGTTFRLVLPLTLATFRGVPVRVGDQMFVLPTADIDRALRVNREAIESVENRETIEVDGRILSIVRLGNVLGLSVHEKKASVSGTASDGDTGSWSVVVLQFADKRIAFQVDEVLDEQQVMVKGLGRQLRRVRNIAGATVLGNGKVVPVLNVADLMKSAVRSAAPDRIVEGIEEASAKGVSILVAEDSITSRTLLKSILETAGYKVTTAVDGMDALTKVRKAQFDLVVSDVDMPEMSGFELTASIRGDTKLAEVPVVLVTGMESREDRERGIDAGASAYIVKSSFDQSNLLDVIHALL